MSLYENNLKILLTYAPYVKGITSEEVTEDLELFPTPTGVQSGKYKGHYIHSRHNPVREATQLIEREIKDKVSSAIFYGFGLGYHIEVFIRKFPRIPVLIIEPDPSFFLKALESRDLTPIFSSPHVFFYIDPDPEKLLSFIERLPLSNIQMIRLRSVYEFNREYYKRIDGIISSYLTKKEINVNTLKRFGKLWITNLIHNIRELIKKPGISVLENTLKNIPSLICASGPSLDLVLPYLPELQKKMVIICVDTSLRACLSHQIEPDFLIIVDPQYWNTRHLDWVQCSKPLIVSESSTHPRVFRVLPLKGFFAGSFFPLGKFIESIVGEKGKIGAGGSVATSAWDIARILGTNPIVMSGLDLGFPGKKTHFHGAYFEQCFHTITDRYAPIEQMSFSYLREAEPFPVPSNDGGLALTDKRMIIYKWWFESQAGKYPSVTTLTLSPGGVAIPGISLSDLDSLLNFPDRRAYINEQLHYITKKAEPDSDPADSDPADSDPADSDPAQSYQKLKKAILNLTANLQTLSNIAGKGIKATRKAFSSMKNGIIPASIIEELNVIDKKITSESSRIIAGFLIQPIIQGLVHTSTEERSAKEILDYTEKLYKELKDSCDFHYDALIRAEKLL